MEGPRFALGRVLEFALHFETERHLTGRAPKKGNTVALHRLFIDSESLLQPMPASVPEAVVRLPQSRTTALGGQAPFASLEDSYPSLVHVRGHAHCNVSANATPDDF
jgi:hypothetical protein